MVSIFPAQITEYDDNFRGLTDVAVIVLSGMLARYQITSGDGHYICSKCLHVSDARDIPPLIPR